MEKDYSLRKCQNLLKEALTRHKSLSHRLSDEQMARFEKMLLSLDKALAAKELESARLFAFQVEEFLQQYGRKTFLDHVKEFLVAVVFALIIAALVRQMWFELYEIPTGSMRPTFLEADRVLAFKDSYCINIPFKTDHFYFEPSLVHRGSIVVLTGDNLDLADVDTTYFGLFPGKRRYVKRSVAKDGDTIYFYGGKIYGIDKEGKPLNELLNSPEFAPLAHIPFITFDGKVKKEKGTDKFTIRHMNLPLAKIEVLPTGEMKSQLVADQRLPSLGDYWGIKNYAMVRLLEPSELPLKAYSLGYNKESAKLYLEIKHSPKLPGKNAHTQPNQTSLLETELTWLPLDSAECQRIKESLYTARFYVLKGVAFRYTPEGPDLHSHGVQLERKIPDGCYEFFNGNAYEIGWGSISHLLEKSHPIYPQGPKLLKALFNSGIELSSSTNSGKENGYFPARYAYYAQGTLCLLSKPFLAKDDSLAKWFLEKEMQREGYVRGYTAFHDYGPPLKDGVIDSEFIKTYGFKIPESHYLLLGDNHSMSNDSRFFGPVPENNLQGSPAMIFWPPGERWGRPPQPALTFFSTSNMIVLSVVIVVSGLSCLLIWRKMKRRKLALSINRRAAPP